MKCIKFDLIKIYFGWRRLVIFNVSERRKLEVGKKIFTSSKVELRFLSEFLK